MNISESKNLWEYRVKSTFENKKKISKGQSILWSIVGLILYHNTKDRLLIDIYNLLNDNELFVKLISLIDGRDFKFPSKEEIEEALLLAVFYYEKEVEKKSWKEIQDSLDFEISPIKWGIKIKNLNNWIKQKLNEVIKIEGISCQKK